MVDDGVIFIPITFNAKTSCEMVYVTFPALATSDMLLSYGNCECNDLLGDCFYSNRQSTRYDYKSNSIRQKMRPFH